MKARHTRDDRSMRIRRVLACSLYPLCAAIVAWLSLMPLPPKVSIDLDFIDKIEHGIAYLALGVLGSIFFALLGRRRVRAAAISVIVGLVLGVGIELLQPLVGRSRELADALVNLAGLSAGSALYLLASRRSPQMQSD